MRQFFWIILSLALLLSCQPDSVTVQYPEGSKILSMNHSGSYSTRVGQNGEAVGTMTSTFCKVTFSKEGNKNQVERISVLDRSKGYHKNSMPFDLAYRIPQVTLVAENGHVNSILGNEHFIDRVVNNLPVKEFFKRQLRDARYILEFDRADKRRFEITHLLQGEYPAQANITSVLQAQKRLPIPQVAIDSVVTQGMRSLEGKDCFDYTVYYQEKEPFPYFIWEQHAYGTDSGAVYRDYHADSAYYQVAYNVSLDLENGLPCREREVKEGIYFMTHKETKQAGTFKAYVTLENLYTEEEN